MADAAMAAEMAAHAELVRAFFGDPRAADAAGHQSDTDDEEAGPLSDTDDEAEDLPEDAPTLTRQRALTETMISHIMGPPVLVRQPLVGPEPRLVGMHLVSAGSASSNSSNATSSVLRGDSLSSQSSSSSLNGHCVRVLVTQDVWSTILSEQ